MKKENAVPLPRLCAFAGLSVAVLAMSSTLAGNSAVSQANQQAEEQTVVRVPVTDIIDMGLAPFIERVLEEATEAGTSAVVLDIATNGGRVDAAQRIVAAISRSEVPVYSFVNIRAHSAGAMIALSAERVFMRTGAVMGAATPVDGQGEKASEKIVSAMRAEMRALAEARGLNPAIAAAMVDEGIVIEGVVEAGKLLTLTTEEAVDLGYAQEVADWEALVANLSLGQATVVDATVNWAERVVRFFTNPVIVPFLLSLGFLGLVIEIKTAGFGLAGAAGLLSLSLFFGSHLLLGLAGAEDLLFVALGIILVGVEVFVIPGFGVFGVLGGLALAGGIYMTLLGQLPTRSDFTTAAGVLAGTMILVAALAWMLLRSLPNNWRLKRSGVLLAESTDADEGYTSADVRPELEGAVGVAITALRPTGVALFDDERLDVVADNEWIEEGTPVRILHAEGYRHVVRTVNQPEIEST